MILEAQLIAFAWAINLAVMSIGFAARWWRGRDPVLRDWAVGCASGAIGSALSAQQGPIPDLLAVACANALMLTYFLCAHSGMRQLSRRRLQPAVWVLPVAAAAIEIYASRFNWQPDVWPLISCYARLSLCLAIIVTLMRHRGAMSGHALLLLFATLLLGALGLMRMAFDAQAQTHPAHVITVDVLTTAFALPMMLGLQSLYARRMKFNLSNFAGVCWTADEPSSDHVNWQQGHQS